MKQLASTFLVGFFAITRLIAQDAGAFTVIPDKVAILVTGKSINATLNGLSADIRFSPEDLAHSSFNATVKVESIQFNAELQTKHAISDKWLDAATYPTITFRSESVRAAALGYEAIGQLTIHGISQSIVLPFTFSPDPQGGSFHGQLRILRTDYGVGSGKSAPELEVDIVVPVTKG
jgi:polyisoprenoid-binding protein YceI